MVYDDGAALGGLASTDYFINRSEEPRILSPENDSLLNRYWEPHTSSIDFCETNYLLTPYVVEPHNVLSSLWGLSLFGLVGILRGNPTNERRFDLAYGVLIIIGLGSAALHGSLHWAFQGADELPMIYLVVVAMYCCIEIDGKPRQPKFPNLPGYLLVLCGMNTAIYFAYQRYYIVFLGTFVAMLLNLVRLHIQIAWGMKQKRNEAFKIESTRATCDGEEEAKNICRRRSARNARLALRFYIWHYLAFALIAVPIWLLDQFRCPELLPIYNSLPGPLRGATLHVVWHACSGLGAFLFVQFLVVCRADALGLECQLGRTLGGVLPVANLSPFDDGWTAKKQNERLGERERGSNIPCHR
mmetsp:Transcript_62392/g.184612  ORF Transcript_62392/g.184612 Transcript_62392/m.184612 type:complete len:357 (-) Transcript_62392:262-1332(-)